MSTDLISRSALITAYDSAHKGPLGGARKLIEDAPAVDAVEVVRCKDCKFYHTEVYGTLHDDWCAVYEHHVFGGDWFCADGVRKEEKPNAEQ